MSPEALELLLQVQKSGDDIGDVDVFQADDGKVVFFWLGGQTQMFKPSEVTGSSTYNASVLKSCPSTKTDPEFVHYVDTLAN